jgi:hypothetical protein
MPAPPAQEYEYSTFIGRFLNRIYGGTRSPSLLIRPGPRKCTQREDSAADLDRDFGLHQPAYIPGSQLDRNHGE